MVDGSAVHDATLAAALARSGSLPPARAVAVIGQVAAAVDAATGEQVLRRDVINPANIVLTFDHAYLLDAGTGDVSPTGPGVADLAYLAPERLTHNAPISTATNVYAMACVLYECLTGAPPYPAGQDLSALVTAHHSQPTPRPSQRAPSIPLGFDEVIGVGLAKNPAERYRSLGELTQAAQQALGTAPALPQPAPPPAQPWQAAPPAEPPAPLPTYTAPPTQPRRGRRRAWIAALAAVTVLILVGATGGIAYWVYDRHYDRHDIVPYSPTIKVDGDPFDITIEPTTHTAYVIDVSGGTVTVIDLPTNTVTTTIKVGGDPTQLGVDPTTHTAYVTHPRGNFVSVIDTTTNTVTTTIKPGDEPLGVAVDPTTHSAYITNYNGIWDDNSVAVIDTTTNNVTTTISFGITSDATPNAVAVDPSVHAAYVTNDQAKSVTVIDTTTNTITETIHVANRPEEITLDTTTHTAYVTNTADNIVSVIDTTTNTITKTIHVGDYPRRVAVDPAVHTAYVGNAHDGTVSVIDTTTNTVTKTIGVRFSQGMVAVDTATHIVYVTAIGGVSIVPIS